MTPKYMSGLMIGIPSCGLLIFSCVLLYVGVTTPPADDIARAVPIGLVVMLVGGIGALIASSVINVAAREGERPRHNFTEEE